MTKSQCIAETQILKYMETKLKLRLEQTKMR